MTHRTPSRRTRSSRSPSQPDARVSRGTEVHITVSQGRSTGDIRVPLVIGKTLGEATKLIEEARLHVGTISYQLSFDLVPNTVVDQFPRPGETAGAGAGRRPVRREDRSAERRDRDPPTN